MQDNENKNYKEYRYNFELRYEYDGEEKLFRHENIHSVAAHRDYLNHNRPLIYVLLDIDKKILDDMIKNINKKKIKFKLEKLEIDVEDDDNTDILNKIPKIKIYEGEFQYIVPTANVNNKKEIEYGGENKDKKDIFTKVMIGLVDDKTVKANIFKLPNTYYYNTKVTDAILHRCENVPKFLFEPLKREKDIVINNSPTTDTVSDFLSIMYKKYKFYDSGYRLFFDFDYSYLISNDGKLVKIRDEEIDSVIFKVHKSDTPESKLKGMVTDLKQRVFFIDVDNMHIEPYEEQRNNNRVQIVKEKAVGTFNEKKVKDLDILFIVKEGLDTNSFTINKEYFIDNYYKLHNKRGRFILIAKKDLYSKHGEYFKVNTTLTLKFVKFE